MDTSDSPLLDVTPPRIAVFVEHLGSGGIEKVAVNIANGLAARGFVLDMLMWRGQGQNLKDLAPNIGAIYFGDRGNTVGVFGAVRRLVQYHRRSRPEVVMSLGEKSSLVALVAGLAAGRRVTIPCVHIDLIAYARANKRIKRGILNAAVATIYPLAREIIAVSEGAAQSARRVLAIFNTPVRLIYNGFDLDALKALSLAPVSESWLTTKTVPVIITCGRLTEQKGFDLLLHAFAILRGRLAARLIILGEGELHGELHELAESLQVATDVMMPGFVPNPISWFAKCGLFVMSSHFEALPTVLIEALVAGVPVLSTDCPSGPREILDGGRFGRLVPVGDTAALAEAMVQAIKTRPVVDQNALAAHLERFSAKQMLDNYEAAIETCYRQPRSSLKGASSRPQPPKTETSNL